MYYAVIDIGSNTIRLVAYRVEQQHLQLLFSRKTFSRLIQNVDNGFLTSDGMDAIASCLKEYLDDLAGFPGIKTFCFASAFFRSLKNTQTVVNEIYSRCFVHVEVLTPQEECAYGMKGFAKDRDPLPYSGLLVGVGGSSTNLTYFEEGVIHHHINLELGSVRQTSSLIHNILPTLSETEAIREMVRQELAKVRWLAKIDVPALHSVGGNGRAIAKLHRHFFKRNEPIHGYEVPISAFEALMEELHRDPQHCILTLNEVVPGRINSLVPGMVILDEIARLTGAKTFHVSRYGTREGFLLSKLDQE